MNIVLAVFIAIYLHLPIFSAKSAVRQLLHREAAAWHEGSLADLELVYLWVDGVHVKAGLEKDKAALLLRIGSLADGRTKCSSRCTT